MQRKIGAEVELGKTVSPLDNIGAPSAIDRSASNYLNAAEKVRKIRKLILTGTYDANIAKYIPATIDLVFQGKLEDINTKEEPAHISYKDMENLDFQIMLANNYYTNPNSIHNCFPVKIKQKGDDESDIHADLIIVNNFFAQLTKEISVTRYRNDKQLMPTFFPYEIYQYSDAVLKHLPKMLSKKLKKQCFIANNWSVLTEQH